MAKSESLLQTHLSARNFKFNFRNFTYLANAKSLKYQIIIQPPEAEAVALIMHRHPHPGAACVSGGRRKGHLRWLAMTGSFSSALSLALRVRQ